MRTIRNLFSASCLATLLTFGLPLFITPAAAQGKPQNATAQCKDGTYSTAKTKQGACSRHGGVAIWYAEAKSDIKAAGKETKEDAKAAAKATKDVAKDAGTVTKDATKDAGKAAKDVAKDTKGTTKSAAKTLSKAGSGAPENATAKCKDGTFSFSKQHSGACSHHGGVDEWYK